MFWGYFLAISAAATFGLIPLFTLPLLANGFSAETILCYRFAIGSLILLVFLFCRRKKLKISFSAQCKLAFLSFTYMLSALFYFHAFRFLPSGMVTTVQFLYPLMVMFIMIVFFKEHFSLYKCTAILLAITGVALLGHGQGQLAGDLNIIGLLLSLLTGLFLALYYIGLRAAKIKVSSLVMTLHIMIWGFLICTLNVIITNSFQWITGWENLCLVFLLAFVTAVLSNYMLILAIKKIGPTMTSILGASEPFTAITVGIFVFHENFTSTLAIGSLLIVASVTLAMLNKK